MTNKSILNELPSGMELIASIGKALQSSRGIDSIFSDITSLALEMMEVAACEIYLYEGDALRLKATRGFEQDEIGRDAIHLGDGSITGTTAMQQKPCAVQALTREVAKEEFGESRAARFKSILSVPMLDGNKLVGVMNLQTITFHDFSHTEKEFMMFVASQLVGAIRNAQLYDEVIRGFKEMATLHQIGQIVNSFLDMEQLLPAIALTCAKHLSARYCILRLIDPIDKSLVIKGAYGVADKMEVALNVNPGEGLAGKVFLSNSPTFIKNASESDQTEFRAYGEQINSLIVVPLSVKGKVIGTLGIIDKIAADDEESGRFEEEDVGLISMIGNQVAMAIENAHLFDEAKKFAREKELRVSELSLLLEITNIMRSSLDLEELLYIILTSVTMGEGLGFNRAALFLSDEKADTLIGKMAVGPLRAEDAAKHWNAIDIVGKTLAEIVMEYGKFNMSAGFRIDNIIKEARIPISPEKGILSQTLLSKETFNVVDYNSPHGSEESVLADVGFYSFASVPLMAKDRVLGAIVVDNLVTKEPITEEMLRFLTLFANQAAIALEMGQVYKNIENTNKRLIEMQDLLVRTKTLATLGEFSAGVAHELRNPLVSIGGFAKRLAKTLEGDSREARYARIIATEVAGLEKILNQILEFVGGASPEFHKIDCFLVIEEVLILFNESINKYGIHAITTHDERIRYLHVDEVQIRQLFINLIKNAIEAMKETGGTLKITSTLMEDGEPGAGFEISDTGVGIPTEDLPRLFDPFFTKKDTGTGLGLSICSRIVETNHNGRIFVDSKIGIGTSILIWLPQAVISPGENQAQKNSG